MEEYQAASALIFPARTIDSFVGYGHWYQRQALPDLDNGRLPASSPCQTALSLSSKRVRLSLHAAWSLRGLVVHLPPADLQVCRVR